MNKKKFSPFVRRRSVRAIVLLAIAATGTLASCDDEATDGNSLPDGTKERNPIERRIPQQG